MIIYVKCQNVYVSKMKIPVNKENFARSITHNKLSRNSNNKLQHEQTMIHLIYKKWPQETRLKGKYMTKNPKETRLKKRTDHQCCMWLDDVKGLVHTKHFIRGKVGRKMSMTNVYTIH
jgi:hypothetical protein